MKLRLEGATDTIDLNSIEDTGTGYQALSGCNLFGLPPMSHQWIEGAGDGALYRGTRVLPREGDLPIDIVGRDRAHLRELVSRLTRVLSKPCNLVAVEESGVEWSTRVVRSGGGGFQFGIDSGERDMQLVLTLTAGDPYFTSRAVTTAVIQSQASVGSFLGNMVNLTVAPSQAVGSIVLENWGDAPAYPVWTVEGPGDNFTATSADGDVLWWTGTLTAGQVLTVDTRTARVTDQTGANRYAELAPAPKFWAIPPGTTGGNVSLLNITTASRVVCSWQARKWLVI